MASSYFPQVSHDLQYYHLLRLNGVFLLPPAAGKKRQIGKACRGVTHEANCCKLKQERRDAEDTTPVYYLVELTTVKQVWEEYTVGRNGGPPTRVLEQLHKNKWRDYGKRANDLWSERKLVHNYIDINMSKHQLTDTQAINRLQAKLNELTQAKPTRTPPRPFLPRTISSCLAPSHPASPVTCSPTLSPSLSSHSVPPCPTLSCPVLS